MGKFVAFIRTVLVPFFCVMIVDTAVMDLKWSLSSMNGELVSRNVVLPFNVHSTLVSAGMISHPYYRFNDFEYRWIPEQDWILETKFNRSVNTTFLFLEGLESPTIVILNGIVILLSDNMFTADLVDVSEFILEDNSLRLHILSPVRYASLLADHHAYDVPPDCPPGSYRGFCHVNFIRKEPSSFSWDWGPAFAPQSVRRVEFMTVSEFSFEMRGISVLRTLNGWIIELTIHVISPSNKLIGATMSLNITELNYFQLSELHHGSSYHSKFWIPDDTFDVKRWWPIHYGDPVLYHTRFQLLLGGKEIWSIDNDLGFRTIELVQEPVYIRGSPKGLSYFFKINDKPVFLKGSNFVPMDSFDTEVNELDIQRILKSAVAANMNILRVWGGGIYQRDYFYELADRLGIMIWQDMMFACALYPINTTFLKNVELEVTQQVQRLKHHPSIVSWSGNNENEKAISQNWYNVSDEDLPLFKMDYVKLYAGVIRPTVLRLDKTRPFIMSSPSNGKQTEESNWISDDTDSELYGDVHFYDYVSDCFDVGTFPVPRLASEYGYQSWPLLSTIERVTIDEDRRIGSRWFNERNHHPDGNSQILALVERHFNFKSDHGNSSIVFNRFAYLSQVEQSLCVKAETEHYLKWQGFIDSQGRGGTMGAMYWQLNDEWQAPSWAGIDYYGKWKLLHYFAVSFFEPFHVFSQIEGDNLYVFCTTVFDENEAARLIIEILPWRVFSEICSVVEAEVQIGGRNSTHISTFRVSDILEGTSCSRADSYIRISLRSVSGRQSVNYQLLVTPKQAEVPCANVTLGNHWFEGASLALQLLSDSKAMFLTLDYDPTYGGRFSRNGFILEQEQTVVYFRDGHVSAGNAHIFLSSVTLHYVNQHPFCI